MGLGEAVSQADITSAPGDAGSWDATLALRIVSDLAGQEGAALPILHALQHEFGYVPKAAEPIIADVLNLSRAEVHGIISFYHDFRRSPGGRHTLRLCRAEACQSVGAVALAARLLERLGLDWHGTTPDRGVTVEPAYCLGLCACGPAAMLDEEPIGRLDDAMLDAIVAGCRA